MNNGKKYADQVVNLLNELKDWALIIVGAATALMIAIYGIKYILGDQSEKIDAMSAGKKTLMMGAGVFFLVFLAGEIVKRFKGI